MSTTPHVDFFSQLVSTENFRWCDAVKHYHDWTPWVVFSSLARKISSDILKVPFDTQQFLLQQISAMWMALVEYSCKYPIKEKHTPSRKRMPIDQRTSLGIGPSIALCHVHL